MTHPPRYDFRKKVSPALFESAANAGTFSGV
jgi:hypothetical protein